MKGLNHQTSCQVSHFMHVTGHFSCSCIISNAENAINVSSLVKSNTGLLGATACPFLETLHADKSPSKSVEYMRNINYNTILETIHL